MTRLIAVFFAGALCGAATTWPTRTVQTILPPPPAHPRNAGVLAGGPGVVLDAGPRDGDQPAARRPALRNLFAFVEPPPQPRPAAPVVLPSRAVAIAAAVTPPQPAVAEPPPFPYRYIGTFGPRGRAFAVFAREGEVVNARVGDAVAERFTLRRIGIESVDLAWGGPGDLRVALTR